MIDPFKEFLAKRKKEPIEPTVMVEQDGDGVGWIIIPSDKGNAVVDLLKNGELAEGKPVIAGHQVFKLSKHADIEDIQRRLDAAE